MNKLRQSKYSFLFFLLLLLILSIPVTILLLRNSQTTRQSAQTIVPSKIEVQEQLVNTFPEFPVYPGAKIESSYKKDEGGKVGYEATWSTSDSIAQVVGFYIKELINSGWKVEFDKEIDPNVGEQMIRAELNEYLSFITLETEEEGTKIHVEFPLR